MLSVSIPLNRCLFSYPSNFYRLIKKSTIWLVEQIVIIRFRVCKSIVMKIKTHCENTILDVYWEVRKRQK